MNPPAPASIALADIERLLDKISNDLPAVLARLEAFKPATPEDAAEVRAVKVAVLFRLGESAHGARDYDTALSSLRAAAAMCDCISQPDAWFKVHKKLVEVLADRALHEEAIPIAKNLLAHCELTLGASHPRILASTELLGSLFLATSDIEGFTSLLRNYPRSSGRNHGRNGPLDHAIESKLSMLLSEAKVGAPHRIGLVNMLQFDGVQSSIESLLRSKLSTNERTMGPTHPSTCLAAYDLAFYLQEQGADLKALPFAEQALKGWMQTLPSGHQHIIDAKNMVKSLIRRLFPGRK